MQPYIFLHIFLCIISLSLAVSLVGEAESYYSEAFVVLYEGKPDCPNSQVKCFPVQTTVKKREICYCLMMKTVGEKKQKDYASFFFKTDSANSQPVIVQDAIEIEILNGNLDEMKVANVTL